MRPELRELDGQLDPDWIDVLEGEINYALSDAIADYRIATERLAKRRRDRQPADGGKDRVAEALAVLMPLLRQYQDQCNEWLKTTPRGVQVSNHIAHHLDREASA